MGFKKRERILLVAAVCCLSILVGDRLILTPMIHLWKNRSRRISELKSSIRKGEILLDREKSLEERWRKMRQASRFDDMSTVENRILTGVHDWAAEGGLNLNSLKPRWSDVDEEAIKLEIRLTATGNLEAVSRFLYALERDTLPLRLEDLSISVRDKQTGTLDFSVRFTSLVLKEDTT